MILMILYVLSPKHHNIYLETYDGVPASNWGEERRPSRTSCWGIRTSSCTLQEWKCGPKQNLRPKKAKIEYVS